MEKSEANAAYFPSFPTIPTPISAAWIIATSLPPSPIERQTFPVYSLMASVTRAFWVGEHLQHTTAGAAHDTYKKFSFWNSSATLRDWPSMTNIQFYCRPNWFNSFCSMSESSISLITNISWVGVFKLVEMAIHCAVSTLSPVNIHIYIPAFLNASMVGWISSWSISSTPVIPNNSISYSKISMALEHFRSRSSRLFLASSYCCFHF